jgi:uncharacterized protein YecE (DUF72 family)
MNEGIYIGMQAQSEATRRISTAKRALSTLEFSYHLNMLPELATLHHVRGSSIRPVWRIVVCDLVTEQKYFLQPSWTSFANALDPLRDTLIISLERTSEYSAKLLDLLCEIVEALYPARCFLEFDHYSWRRAEQVLCGAKCLVVTHDAPELPALVGDLQVNGKHAYLRLLGRNRRAWFEHRPSERFAYTYTRGELVDIAIRIRSLKEECDSVTAIIATYPPECAIQNANALASLALASLVGV